MEELAINTVEDLIEEGIWIHSSNINEIDPSLILNIKSYLAEKEDKLCYIRLKSDSDLGSSIVCYKNNICLRDYDKILDEMKTNDFLRKFSEAGIAVGEKSSVLVLFN